MKKPIDERIKITILRQIKDLPSSRMLVFDRLEPGITGSFEVIEI